MRSIHSGINEATREGEDRRDDDVREQPDMRRREPRVRPRRADRERVRVVEACLEQRDADREPQRVRREVVSVARAARRRGHLRRDAAGRKEKKSRKTRG